MLDADLKEFEDYLSEFNSVPKFDSEICPICGIDYSDAYLGAEIPLIELRFENENVARTAISKLEKSGIKSKRSSNGKEKILIPEQKLEDAKSILKS
jgi:hypothetical protein